jgi:hypothetical protein
MKRLLLLVPLLLLSTAAACGGSSSETPWQVEPDVSTLGPAGEALPSDPAIRTPDGGAPPRAK